MGGKKKVVEIQKRHQELKTAYSHVDVSGFKSHSLRQESDRSLDGFG
jgi:hypothetical protein